MDGSPKRSSIRPKFESSNESDDTGLKLGAVSQSNCAEAVFLNADVMSSVFKHLNEQNLKGVSSVCSVWTDEIASYFRHPVIELVEAGLYAHRPSFPNLHRIDVLIDYGRRATFDRRRGLPTSHFPSTPAESIGWNMKSHNELRFYINVGRVDISTTTQCLLDILRQATNLKELSIIGGYYNEPCSRAFWDLFLGSEGLGVNNMLPTSLESLHIDSGDLVPLDFTNLRLLHFGNLKNLELRIADDNDNVTDAINMWLSTLSSCLESFRLQGSFGDRLMMDVEFLESMDKLKCLRLYPRLFDMSEGLLPMLERLPSLETIVMDSSMTTGITRHEFFDANVSNLCYRTVRNFQQIQPRNLFSYTETERERERDRERRFCQINEYVPRLFPNLSTLRMMVCSKQHLFAIIRDLHEMKIQELYLTLKLDLDSWIPADVRESIPSLNTWKHIRKLSIRVSSPEYNPTEVYRIPMDEFVPKTITSFRLCFRKRLSPEFQTEVEFSVLLSLMRGLPCLMHCSLDYGNVVLDGRTLNLSEIRAKLHVDPLLHPYLYFGGRHY